MNEIAVLGCGPAGLMAIHAAKSLGLPVVSISKKEKSKLGGAQFLHYPIPEINGEPEGEIVYRVKGDALTYQRKTYGTMGPQPSFVSFSNVSDGMAVNAWNLARTYDQLWDGYESFINEGAVDGAWLEAHMDDYSMVVSTIPRSALCLNRRTTIVPDGSDMPGAHSFYHKNVRIVNGRCFGMEGVTRNFGENVINYNGTKENSWYRSSDLWGVKSTEWGDHTEALWLPYETVNAQKPLSTTCDCHTGKNILFVGRYGKWDKGQLTHSAYYETREALASALL